MPGYILHNGASTMCGHAGTGMFSAPVPRVKVAGQPVVLQSDVTTVAGCPFTTPAGVPLPCVTAQWTTGSTRVKVQGQPVLLMDSQATTVPNGVPMSVVSAQARVKGT